MEAKLIKVDDIYRLVEDTKHGNSIIGTTDLDYQKSWSDRCQKLSIKNCQAIERGYDLDELAEKYSENIYYKLEADEEFSGEPLGVLHGFKDGFQKALEILGDKKFSEDDMNNAMNWIMNQYFEFHEQPTTARHENYIQSLQQTEWEVEVEMEKVPVKMPGIMVFTKAPKLDADGCLILKRI